MIKNCPKCKKDLNVSFFNKSNRRDGYQTYCRECHNQIQRDKYLNDPMAKIKRQIRAGRRKERDPLVQRRSELKRLYGITLEDYVEMFDSQNGVCAICFKECKTKNSLSVDHDHTTGKVRGLLCNACNRAIGMLGDSPEILRKAADYLEN
jgi:uncharacterized protein YbaR (Trm112 family)